MKNKTGNMEKTLKQVQGDISGLCKTSNEPTCVALQGDKLGFTLAEVLITIGIIGVVAALTIPTLVNNYQTRSWNISSSNFEAKFGEALKIMNTQQSLSNLGTTERFVNELQKHMKVAKVCNNEELTLCFPDEINGSTSVIDVTDPTTYENNSSTPTQTKTIKTAKELGQKDWNTNTMGVQFANGVSAILAYNPKCSANPFDVNAVTVSGDKENITFGTDCVAMVYDTSSNAQPNEKGKDIRTSSMATVGDGDCIFKIDGACVNKIMPSSTGVSKSECESMMDTYDIPSCSLDNDVFAGAVKACGGRSKMVNSTQLAKLANYLYDVDNIGDFDYISGLTINYDKSNLLGLNFLQRDSIWMSDTAGHSSAGAWSRRVFTKNATFYNGRNRDDVVHVYTVCIGD